MPSALLSLAALAAIVLAAFGAQSIVNAIGDFSDTRIEQTRTAVPGSRSVRLDAGRHVVFYEVDERSAARDVDGDPTAAVPALDVDIRRRGDGRRLDLDDYTIDFDVTGGGRFAQAAATVEVPAEAVYEIEASGDAGERGEPAVVLGRPITGRVLRLVVGIAALLAGLGLLALALAIGVVSVVRRRRAD